VGSTPCLLYTILCVVFEARVINLCDRDIATFILTIDQQSHWQRTQYIMRGANTLIHVARQKIRAASAGDSFHSRLLMIGSLESPPSNLLRATRKPDVLVLSEIHGKGTGCG